MPVAEATCDSVNFYPFLSYLVKNLNSCQGCFQHHMVTHVRLRAGNFEYDFPGAQLLPIFYVSCLFRLLSLIYFHEALG